MNETFSESELIRYFPSDLSQYVSDSWDMLSKQSDFLYHGMTLAVIYVAHLWQYRQVSLDELSIPESEASRRREC